MADHIRLAPFKIKLGKNIDAIHAKIMKLRLSDPVRIYWECATDVRRNGVLVAYIRDECGVSEDVVDAAFRDE